jgi:phospholipid/cholesterol/gamma-HCH transport system permease protein
MPESPTQARPEVRTSLEGSCLGLRFTGTWRITDNPPRFEAPPRKAEIRSVSCDLSTLQGWDNSLVLYLLGLKRWCSQQGLPFPEQRLSDDLRVLVTDLERSQPRAEPKDRSTSLFIFVGEQTVNLWAQCLQIADFVGECSLALNRLARAPLSFRWRDCLAEMQECGAMALPIVSLVSFLVGVTLAYTGAIVLRMFGGDIWIADMIGLSITREMAAVMTGVVLAGRTGAAYAAQIGNMKANEEIDALTTLGVPAIDFLVIPRMLALALMTPLLALYSMVLGVFGGMLIAYSILKIPPAAYFIEMMGIVDVPDICTGLIKASAFGLIVGMCGCLRGMQAERSSQGVGKAATSAVVTTILLMVVADALFAVIFNILGL